MVLGGRPFVLRRDSRKWACVALALSSACGGDGRPSAAPPHLLLVSVDCLRADHLSCYGYERETSPRLDRLAAEGVRFERAWSTTSWTLPAHLSMLTGLPISAHGVDDDRLWLRRDERGEPIPPPLRGVFVPEVLRAAGYATAGFYTWKYLEPQFGFGPGFDVYERLGHTFYSHPVVGPEFERLRAAGDVEGQRVLLEEYPLLFDDTHPSSPETIDRARGWIDEHLAREDGRPFFLFVHLFDVHDPYHPPEPWYSLFDPDYEGPIDGRRITAPDSPVHPGMDPRDLERVISLYDGAIAFVDSEIGRLLDHLEERGVADDTLVVVTADHGEEFFEHGRKTHRNQIHVESVEVPMILRWPGGLPAGRVVRGNVGLVDVAATLCAAAGVEPPPNAGVELLSIARGERSNGVRPYLSELVRFEPGEDVPRRALALTRGAERTILETRGARPWAGERFDLAADPGEQAGSPADEAGISEELRALREELARLRASLPERGDGAEAMTEADLAELAAMGYAGAEEPVEGADSGRLSFDGGVWPDD